MRIAYIILVHRYPDQLKRLVSRLIDPGTFFFIHVDKSSEIKYFQRALASFSQEKIFFTERQKGTWGRLGIVLGTLNGIKAALNKNIDYAILLSGQDYPIKSNSYINNFLKRNNGKSFIDYDLIDQKSDQKLRDRITRYYFRFPDYFTLKGYTRVYPPYQNSKNLGSVVINKLFKLRFFRKRKFPSRLLPYRGFQWWCLHQDALKYILKFLKNRPDYIKFHRWSLLPDEMFFQSILLNEKDKEFVSRIISDDLRYVDWHKPNPPYPAVLKSVDFGKLKNTHHLFARKFDATIDTKILDKIDKELLK